MSGNGCFAFVGMIRIAQLGFGHYAMMVLRKRING
jgi:hypothetical protein